jgi:hypothetical protein
MASLEGWNFTIKLCPRRWPSCRERAGVPSGFSFTSLPIIFPATSSLSMKRTALFLFLAASLLARADLTIVQKVEMGSTAGEMTIRIKGDKVRVDPAPQVSMITDSKTGDTITLMHDQKKALRMSGDKMKAAAEMVNKFTGGSSPAASQRKLTPLGRKEQVNGMSTELYSIDTPVGKATYYIASNYPDASAILEEMQATQPAALASTATNMPDFRDLPGVPVKIEMDAHNRHIVMTLVSINRDPIPASEFIVPPGYSDMKMPEIFGGKNVPKNQDRLPVTPNPKSTP